MAVVTFSRGALQRRSASPFAVVGRLCGIEQGRLVPTGSRRIFCGIVFVITMIAFGVGETIARLGIQGHHPPGAGAH